MAQYEDTLNSVKIASPCSADWEDMVGNDRNRFCGQCELNVYNLSDMTRHEAERLINQTEGRLCVRFYRRTDGTILTRDCPVGLRAVRRRVSKIRNALVSSVLGFIAGLGFYEVAYEDEQPMTMGVMEAPMLGSATSSPISEITGKVEMGGAPSSSERSNSRAMHIKSSSNAK